MSQEQQVVTQEGFQKLKDELQYLQITRRQEVAERLKEALSYGDLSENSEYQESKEEQAFLEGKIIELEKTIKTVVVAKNKKSKTVIHLGSKFSVQIGDQKRDLTLVGATEAEPFNGMISNESPVGKAVMGSKKGDVIEVETPKGKVTYTILSLS